MKHKGKIFFLLLIIDVFLFKNLLSNMATTNEMQRLYEIFDFDVKLLTKEATLPKNALQLSIGRCDSIQLEIQKCKRQK